LDNRRAERGHSFIEITMVSALVGILMTMGALNVRQALAREETDGWVRTIASELTAGQHAALNRRALVTATFQNRVFAIAVAGGGVLRQETLPAHMTFGATQQSVTFDRRGTPSGDLAITVSSTSGRSYQITIAAATGQVSYSEP
jgi:Tfp pilus assembly protein FimT